MTQQEKDNQEETNEADLKEIAHWYGGWDELRKVIDKLEESDSEAAYERFVNRG